jgi:RNA polymerase sigma-70 factor, ECF subfamily
VRDHANGLPHLSRDDFTCLVECHQRQLHVYLAGLVGHEEQAFDLVQETFCEAWRAAQRGTPPFVPGAAESEMRRWLFRAGSNNAISQLRRRRLIRWQSLDRPDGPELAGEGCFDEHLVESDALRTALRQLAPQDAACLLLRIVHGFSAAEVGLILHTSADNVNNRLARAKQRLRAAYARELPGQPGQPGQREEQRHP